METDHTVIAWAEVPGQWAEGAAGDAAALPGPAGPIEHTVPWCPCCCLPPIAAVPISSAFSVCPSQRLGVPASPTHLPDPIICPWPAQPHTLGLPADATPLPKPMSPPQGLLGYGGPAPPPAVPDTPTTQGQVPRRCPWTPNLRTAETPDVRDKALILAGSRLPGKVLTQPWAPLQGVGSVPSNPGYCRQERKEEAASVLPRLALRTSKAVPSGSGLSWATRSDPEQQEVAGPSQALERPLPSPGRGSSPQPTALWQVGQQGGPDDPLPPPVAGSSCVWRLLEQRTGHAGDGRFRS